MKQLKLSPERCQPLIEQVQTLFARNFDESLSASAPADWSTALPP